MLLGLSESFSGSGRAGPGRGEAISLARGERGNRFLAIPQVLAWKGAGAGAGAASIVLGAPANDPGLWNANFHLSSKRVHVCLTPQSF